MKSYKEMANSVFERRNSYLLRKRKIKSAILRYGTPLLCLVLVCTLVLVTGYNPPSLPSSNPSTPTITNQSTTSSKPPVSSEEASSVIESKPPVISSIPSVPSSQTTSSQPKEDVIWIPNLPHLDKEQLQGDSSNSNGNAEPVVYYPYFDDFVDFEQWFVTGELGDNISDFHKQEHKKEYLEKWVYMWKNADYTLQTGYYYKPIIKNSNDLTLNSITTYITEATYNFYYNYIINSDVPCDYSDAYELKIFSDNDDWVQEEFKKDLNDAKSSQSGREYLKSKYNEITYHVFKGNSISEHCNFIGIYWEQDHHWYYAYFLASKEDPECYKTVIQNLNMVKTPFREDLKP